MRSTGRFPQGSGWIGFALGRQPGKVKGELGGGALLVLGKGPDQRGGPGDGRERRPEHLWKEALSDLVPDWTVQAKKKTPLEVTPESHGRTSCLPGVFLTVTEC